MPILLLVLFSSMYFWWDVLPSLRVGRDEHCPLVLSVASSFLIFSTEWAAPISLSIRLFSYNFSRSYSIKILPFYLPNLVTFLWWFFILILRQSASLSIILSYIRIYLSFFWIKREVLVDRGGCRSVDATVGTILQLSRAVVSRPFFIFFLGLFFGDLVYSWMNKFNQYNKAPKKSFRFLLKKKHRNSIL